MKMNRRTFLKTVGAGLSGAAALGLVAAAGETRRPNILFFYPDQHRYDWTSIAKGDASRQDPDLPDITPNLRRLAKHGVHFTNALSPAPVCAPSRACRSVARCTRVTPEC